MADPAILALSALNRLAHGRLLASDIPYGAHRRLRLDVYAPSGRPPFPALLYFYGGGWRSGCKEMYRFTGAAFAAAGFLTVIPDYRIYPEARFPAFLEDCAASVAWVRRNSERYGADGAGPSVIGHSAGAYNAAMLALDATWLGQCGLKPRTDLGPVVGLAGPYDFLPITGPTLKIIFGPERQWPRTQPIRFVSGDNPPMLLLAGGADRVVVAANSSRLAARIRAAGGSADARLYRWTGHAGILGALAPQLRLLAPTFRDCVRFLGHDRIETGDAGRWPDQAALRA